MAELLFEGAAGSGGFVRFFGSVGVPLAAATARAELWSRRVMHALRRQPSLVHFIGGDSTTVYGSQHSSAVWSASSMEQYIDEASRTDTVRNNS